MIEAYRGMPDRLREMADAIEAALEKPPELAVQGISIVEAAEKCVQAGCVTVHVEATYAHKDTWNHEPRLSFQIWDGSKHFDGKTLADAVNKCLLAHRPEQTVTAEQVNELVPVAKEIPF